MSTCPTEREENHHKLHKTTVKPYLKKYSFSAVNTNFDSGVRVKEGVQRVDIYMVFLMKKDVWRMSKMSP